MIGYGDDTTFLRMDRTQPPGPDDNQPIRKVPANPCYRHCYRGSTSSASVRLLLFRRPFSENPYPSADWEKACTVSIFPLRGGCRAATSSWLPESIPRRKTLPIYPTVKAIYSYYFDIYTQDDASRNDGSFNFQVIRLRRTGICDSFGALSPVPHPAMLFFHKTLLYEHHPHHDDKDERRNARTAPSTNSGLHHHRRRAGAGGGDRLHTRRAVLDSDPPPVFIGTITYENGQIFCSLPKDAAIAGHDGRLRELHGLKSSPP